jgi:hypothetical protein
MAARTISSPGVQINEVDLSLIARPTGETNVFMAGFADQGPTDEVINITSLTEYEEIFGLPTNAAERYTYHSARQLLTTSPANLLVTRMPYGSGAGEGYTNSYSALVYPVVNKGVGTTLIGITSINLTNVGTNYTSLPSIEVIGGGTNGNTPINTATAVALSGNVQYGRLSGILVTSGGTGYVYGQTPTVTFAGGGGSNASAVANLGVVGTITNEYSTSNEYEILEPYSILLTEDEYTSLIENDVAWSDAHYNVPINNFEKIGFGGIVVVNAAKTTVSNQFEGYYVGFADNSSSNPATNYDAISGIKAANYVDPTNSYQSFTYVPSSRLNFKLTENYQNFGSGSISEIIENYPTSYDFATNKFNDYLTLAVFKLRPTTFTQDTVTLDYLAAEAYSGSLYSNRTQQNPNGGAFLTSFLDNLVNSRSANIKVITNPNISQTGEWINSDGSSKKTIRVQTNAKNLYSVGTYKSNTDKVAKDVGNVPIKLQRILRSLENNDSIDLDVVIEAGLGTIWTSAKERKLDPLYSNQPQIFDDTYPLDISDLKNTTGALVGGVREDYYSILDQFVTFADKTRKDHVFISDPLRNIFVKGSNVKTSRAKNFIFSTDIYWPLRNLYAGVESSYVATYGNWIRTNDTASDSFCWVPASGYIASIFATSAQTSFPWAAPAGFTRGTLFNVSDIAINPTQKQRDLLYKININPIAFFPNDGNVVFGQKTLYRKPSAFDRINVRRLFLTLEKSAQAVLKFFVFEPNTFATRSRVTAALSPIFDQARLNEGLYDYAIVCDERNNTPNVIDNNELRVSLYIQPVRTAEFILADFIATRTGVNFEEVLS